MLLKLLSLLRAPVIDLPDPMRTLNVVYAASNVAVGIKCFKADPVGHERIVAY